MLNIEDIVKKGERNMVFYTVVFSILIFGLVIILEDMKKKDVDAKTQKQKDELDRRLAELENEEDAERETLVENLSHNLIALMKNHVAIMRFDKTEKRTLLVTNEERLVYYEEIEKKIIEALNITRLSDIKDIIKKTKYETEIQRLVNNQKYIGPWESKAYRTLNGKDNYKEVESYFNANLNCFYDLLDVTNRQYQDILMDYLAVKRGLDGEAYVNRILNDYYDVINLENIRLEIEDKQGQIQSVENDNILITRQGIFILEVKNYGSSGSYDLVIERDGRWLKRFSDGKVEAISNATGQNNRHVNYVSKFINEYLKQDFNTSIPVYGVVIIPNDSISIYNQDPLQDIYRASQIYQFIMSKDVVLSHDKMKQIETLIKKHKLPPKSYPLVDQADSFIQHVKFIQQQSEKYEIWVNKSNELMDNYVRENIELNVPFTIKYNAILDEYPYYIICNYSKKELDYHRLKNMLF